MYFILQNADSRISQFLSWGLTPIICLPTGLGEKTLLWIGAAPLYGHIRLLDDLLCLHLQIRASLKCATESFWTSPARVATWSWSKKRCTVEWGSADVSSDRSDMSTVKRTSWSTWKCCVPDVSVALTGCRTTPSTPPIRVRPTLLPIWKLPIAALTVRSNYYYLFVLEVHGNILSQKRSVEFLQ